MSSLKKISDISVQECEIKNFEERISVLKQIRQEMASFKIVHAKYLTNPELLSIVNQISQNLRNPEKSNDVEVKFNLLKQKITAEEQRQQQPNIVFSQLPRVKLKEIISRYGISVIDEPKKVKGLLFDYCVAGSPGLGGQYQKEVNVLMMALDHRVPQDILAAIKQNTFDLQRNALRKRLRDLALDENAADWAVDAWAEALRI